MRRLATTALVLNQSTSAHDAANTGSLTKYGAHESHTKHDDGRFKHPFAEEDESIRTIHYPDSKTFSVRLDRMEFPSRHHRNHARSIE